MLRAASICCLLLTATIVAAIWHTTPVAAGDVASYKDARVPIEDRVTDLLGRMTLDEKLRMLSGSSWMETTPNARLGIPPIRMSDGPAGVRPATGPGGAGSLPAGLSYPVGVALAATWDSDAVRNVGRAIGLDARALGRDMVLGPTVNIHRDPRAGRNFESFGEDPWLAARLAVSYIQGLQGEGVIAAVKHFAVNNQETDRFSINAIVDERALREIYLPAFRAAVQEAGAWAVMSAYNKVNGTWCAENKYLLTNVLKREWGFQGFIVSDWVSTHSTIETANAGLDLEMPGTDARRALFQQQPALLGFAGGHVDAFLNPPELLAAIRQDKIPAEAVDDKVRRILRAMFSIGLFDPRPSARAPVGGPEQHAAARRAATEAIVLLKNAGPLLPLTPDTARSIAVIGPNAGVARIGGGGSSEMKSEHAVSPLAAIRARVGDRIRVAFAEGCSMPDPGRIIPPVPPSNILKDDPAAREVRRRQAAQLARESDVALIFAGYYSGLESEGFDRDPHLPPDQDRLIEAVVAANPKTIVILNSGSPVLMNRWIHRVPAVVNAWYLGEEGGPALAAILFGDSNPSGKLPMTFPREAKDFSAFGNFPGAGGSVEYREGRFVGYRHFDGAGVEPLFPFGHGLSYTTFAYENLRTASNEARVDVRNTGRRAGGEVVQLYLRDPASLSVKELRGFRRIELGPGETRTVVFRFDREPPGTYEILIAASSRDIRLKGTLTR